MREESSETVNPVTFKFETHLECCISVAGFNDKRQNVTAYVSHIRGVGWESKMSSQGFVRIFVLNILKVFIKPFMKGAFSLTYILEATNFAGEAIDNVVAVAANFAFRRKFFAQFFGNDVSWGVNAVAIFTVRSDSNILWFPYFAKAGVQW